MSSYAHFAMPTCRQAAMCIEFVRAPKTGSSSFGEKTAVKQYYSSGAVSRIKFMLQRSAIGSNFPKGPSGTH